MTRLRPLNGEEGTTLVELLMVMIMMGVIGSVVGSAVMTSFRVQRRQMTQVEAMQDMKLAFERVTRDVRAADPLLAGTNSTQVVTRICRSGAPIDRTYRLQAGQLLGPGDNVLASDLSHSAAEPMFVYRGFSPTGAHPIIDLDAEPSRLNEVRFVTIRLRRTMPDPAGDLGVIDLRNRITVRNEGGGTCF